MSYKKLLLLLTFLMVFMHVNCQSETTILVEQGFTTYTIDSGKQNFKPRESLIPISARKNHINLQMVFDSSAYWSLADWGGDSDIYDYNKSVGMTAAFSENNRNAVFIGWRPNVNAPYTWDVVAYVNDGKKGWSLSDPITAFAGDVIELDLELRKTEIKYILSNGDKVRHGGLDWTRPWYKKYRWSGTWIGGSNNSPGPYGGESTQKMKIYGKSCKE